MTSGTTEKDRENDRASDTHTLGLKAAQISQLYDQAPYGVYGATVTVFVVTAVLWNVVPRWPLVAWCVVATAVYVVRQRLVSAYARTGPKGKAQIPWGYWYSIGTGISAILWSSAGVFLFPEGATLYQAFLSLMVCGICVGAMAAYCPVRQIYLPYILVVMIPLAGRFIYEGDHVHVTIGATAILLMLCLVVIGDRMHRNNTQSLEVRFENQDLIMELTEKEARAQALNQELQTEISDRVHAEHALRQSEERYRQILDNANDMIYTCDLRGKFTFVNPVALRITGYCENEFLGFNYHDLVPEEFWRQIEEFYQALLGGTTSETYIEFPVISADGTGIWMGHDVQSIVEDGTAIGFQGICRDITAEKRAQDALREARDMLEHRVSQRTVELSAAIELLEEEIAHRKRTEKLLKRAHLEAEERARECRASEERFRTIFDAAEDCMFIKDTNLVYTHANPALLTLMGIDESQLVGKTDREIFGPDYFWQTQHLEQRVLQAETLETEQTVVWNDLPITLHVIRFPMHDATNAIVGLCGIARDITDRRQRERVSIDSSPNYVSFAFLQTLRQIDLAAGSDTLVLFLGETGSGKDWLARHLHDHSKHKDGPYYSVNCTAIPAHLMESELFGHERGAFTGAHKTRRGLIELAEGGTLLLNEIGEMPPALQAKLLSFLDERSFHRVGGEKSISPDCRIIAATNRDLKQEVANGKFREDLFYRVNVFTITVPALRDRKEDIPVLVGQRLERLCRRTGKTRLPVVDPAAMRALADYHWPGNVRELGNVLERAWIRCDGRRITLDDLGFERSAGNPGTASEVPSLKALDAMLSKGESFHDAVDEVKRCLIQEALARSGGSIKQAAQLLQVTRGSITHHMSALDIKK